MLECLSMLCVMIAAKQPRFSIQSSQNHQKISKSKQQANLNFNCVAAAEPKLSAAAPVEKNETRSENLRVVADEAAPPSVVVLQEAPPNGEQVPADQVKKTTTTTGSAQHAAVQMQQPSTKIQQKQQRFLAAAAKSATSPPDGAAASASAAVAAASKRPTSPPPQPPSTTTVSETPASAALTPLSPSTDQQHQSYQVQSLKQTPSTPPFTCCKTADSANSILQQNHSHQQQNHHHHQNHLHHNHQNSNSNNNHHQQPQAPQQHHNIIINHNVANPSNQQPSIQRQQQFLNFNQNNNNNHNHHQYQYQPQQQQHAMAHYKFHNDCQSSVLTYEQVKRLDFVMDQTVPIHGRGNFPTLYVKLKELIRLVKYKLQKEHSIEIRDVRLNGGASNYVLAPENSHYNDLDLIFGTDLSNEDQFDVIRDVVLDCLKEFYPNEQQREHLGCAASASISQELPTTASEVPASNGSLVNIASTKGATDNSNNNSGSGPQSHSTTCDSERPKTPEMDKGSSGDNEASSQKQQQKESEKSVMNESESFNCSNTNETVTEDGESGPSDLQIADNLKQQQQQQLSAHFQNQHQPYQMPLSSCAIKEAYVHKMVKVNDDDRWSLISLGVQQSEANCCGQNCCLSSAAVAQGNNQCRPEVKQQQYRQPFSTNLTDEKEPNALITSQSNAQMISNENQIAQANFASSQHNYQQATYGQHQHQPNRNHYHLQQKQFPNSIELKFVDRMRRKFEFSVDSFQIILDSLIQFYDYAPQSTIASQKILINSHPSSTMINTRPLINKRRSNGCCGSTACKADKSLPGNLNEAAKANRESYESSNNQRALTNGYSSAKTCESLNSTRSYYQLPIEPANSPSISSVASSSGCSSSSSVVSSSSSSLSCDEDHEDLYCETYSPSSSSASTSSLLSSTNLSLLSSDGLSNTTDITTTSYQKHNQPDDLSNKQQSAVKRSETDSAKNTVSKMKSALSAVDSSLASSKVETFECSACLGQEENLVNNLYDFETKNRTSCAVISENFYPTVIGRSEYGNFKEALYHLEKKLIATRSPEEIRGGGLLKYCNLLVKNYKPTNVYQIRTLERYMCSRFFIDFSDLNQQQAKLESYLANHFSGDPLLKFDYLTVLHNVVQRSTVCLMNHELRLTLNMIRDLAYKLNEQQEQQNQNQLQQNHHQTQQQLPQNHQVQQTSLSLSQQQQQQQPHYYQQKPVLIQSGIYRVKLVNYTLAKPTGS